MKYKCTVCGSIYDEEKEKNKFDDIESCPSCGCPKFLLEKTEEKEEKDEYNFVNAVKISKDNPSIERINEKCIDCGMCAKICMERENIKDICSGELCVNCGQCTVFCPTSALIPKIDKDKFYEAKEKGKVLVAYTSPSVRVSLGDEFNLEKGSLVQGKLVSSLRKLGFNYVFDVTFAADLTIMEEANELIKRIKNNETLPMFTSCCPSWVKYASIYHPDILKDLSSCDSPIGMESTIIKKYFAKEEDIDLSKFILVALTPCTSKKEEIINGSCDYVLTTSELSLMLRENNVDFKALEDEEFDSIVGSSSGTIYGFSGGVALSVLRVLYYYETGKDLTNDLVLISDKEYYKEIKVKINSKIIKCASVSTMGNLEKLLNIKDEFDLIEVMNCDGGCISGGGQILMPIADMQRIKEERSKSLQKKDYKPLIKYPYKNEYIKEIYDEFLEKPGSNISKKLLHVKHKDLSDVLTNKKETSD